MMNAVEVRDDDDQAVWGINATFNNTRVLRRCGQRISVVHEVDRWSCH